MKKKKETHEDPLSYTVVSSPKMTTITRSVYTANSTRTAPSTEGGRKGRGEVTRVKDRSNGVETPKEAYENDNFFFMKLFFTSKNGGQATRSRQERSRRREEVQRN